MPAVDDLLSDPDKTAHEVWTDMITYLHENGATIPIVAKAARDQLNRPEEEAGSVLSTTLSYLTIYRDPVVAKNVSRSDFHIRDLMHSEEPVTLYIVTEPVDKQRLQPLVRVLVNMIVRLSATGLSFERGMPKANYRHRLLLMLDEFASSGGTSASCSNCARVRLCFLRGTRSIVHTLFKHDNAFYRGSHCQTNMV